jgi:hypothetical protein
VEEFETKRQKKKKKKIICCGRARHENAR